MQGAPVPAVPEHVPHRVRADLARTRATCPLARTRVPCPVVRHVPTQADQAAAADRAVAVAAVAEAIAVAAEARPPEHREVLPEVSADAPVAAVAVVAAQVLAGVGVFDATTSADILTTATLR